MRKQMETKRTICITAGSILLLAGAADAQTVDYGSFESLFGEPVTTSATGSPQRASEVPANMTIITADEIRQSGSRSIPEIIGIYVPGTDILRQGINGFDVGMRGYQQPTNPRLQVLVDGRQVFIDDYSRPVWDNIPVNIDDIRQIEVVVGASSALFGSNAGGGAINIVTYSPVYDKNNVASAGIGSQRERNLDFTTTVNGSWGGTKISGGGMNENEFDVPRPAGDPTPLPPRHRYIADSSVFQVTQDLQLDTEVTYAESTALIGDPTDSYTMGNQVTTTYSFRGGAHWQTPYGLISVDNYFNHSFMDLYEPANDGGLPYISTTTLLFNQIQDQFKIGADNTFRIAFEQRYKTYRNVDAQIIPLNPEFSDENSAISGMWLWQINDKLSWTNSLRGDRSQENALGDLAPGLLTKADYSHVTGSWSANSDFVYRATDLDSIRFGYGRGIEQPSFLNSGFSLLYLFGSIYNAAEGNPRLKPTVVEDYNADYTRKLPDLSSSVKLSVFYEFNRDIMAPFIFTNSCTVVSGTCYYNSYGQNVGNSQGLGGEIAIKGSHKGWRWGASYSVASLRDSDETAALVDYQKSAPEYHLHLNGGYTMGKWELDANSQLVSSTDMIRSYDGGQTTGMIPTSGYFSMGARVGYNIDDHFTLALSGNNITQQYTTESPYPQIERQVFLSLTGRY
jgi:iron complex outermembrane receptor protein